MTITYIDLGDDAPRFTILAFEYLTTYGIKEWACNESILMVL
jgi:hypothetical protein